MYFPGGPQIEYLWLGVYVFFTCRPEILTVSARLGCQYIRTKITIEAAI